MYDQSTSFAPCLATLNRGHWLPYTKSLRSSQFSTTLFAVLETSIPFRSALITQLGRVSYDDVEDEADDLHLTDVSFIKDWLPNVCGELRLLSISGFWVQSCWRKSYVLALISSCLDDLYLMLKLTNLTLEFIRLEDEKLRRINDCFPLCKFSIW